jgi:hypothetical protein
VEISGIKAEVGREMCRLSDAFLQKGLPMLHVFFTGSTFCGGRGNRPSLFIYCWKESKIADFYYAVEKIRNKL